MALAVTSGVLHCIGTAYTTNMELSFISRIAVHHIFFEHALLCRYRSALSNSLVCFVFKSNDEAFFYLEQSFFYM